MKRWLGGYSCNLTPRWGSLASSPPGGGVSILSLGHFLLVSKPGPRLLSRGRSKGRREEWRSEGEGWRRGGERERERGRRKVRPVFRFVGVLTFRFGKALSWKGNPPQDLKICGGGVLGWSLATGFSFFERGVGLAIGWLCCGVC